MTKRSTIADAPSWGRRWNRLETNEALAVLGGVVGFLGEFAVPFASARRLAVGKMRRGALGTEGLSFVLFADI